MAAGERTPAACTPVNAYFTRTGARAFTLGTREVISWKSQDGATIEGVLIKPANFDATKKYPLILNIHGGPHAAYGFVFDHEFQWMAAKGYVVLYPNPRGSSNYGQDFGNVIQFHYPGDDYKDLMLGVDEAIKRGYIDATENTVDYAILFVPNERVLSFLNECDAVFALRRDIARGLSVEHRTALLAFYANAIAHLLPAEATAGADGTARMDFDLPDADIVLDEESVARRSPEVEHEREVAIFDLLERNRFALENHDAGVPPLPPPLT